MIKEWKVLHDHFEMTNNISIEIVILQQIFNSKIETNEGNPP